MDDTFLSLNKYPSFGKLESKNKIFIVEKINEIIRKGIQEKWYINKNELIINETPLANGSNSVIYKCKWRNLEIVIKRPKTKKISILLDILKEIEIWSTLRHPNLVQFLGISFNLLDEDFLILLERVRGTNLKEYIKPTLSLNIKYKICNQLINAIHFLHTCNPPVIYRDLKPENIMIDEYNNVKLIDFGLSRFMPQESIYKLSGETGTLRYMAPEVYLSQDYDLKVDVYSFGLIMYYIFTNKIPFKEYNKYTIDAYFTNPELIFNTDKIKNKEIRHCINMCIQKNRGMRWSSSEVIHWFNEHNINQSCLIS